MTLSEIRAQRQVLPGIASRHAARNVRLFGSTACGTSGSDSDVDLLVDLEPGRTLLDPGGLLTEITGAVGARADVATERMLRPDIRFPVRLAGMATSLLSPARRLSSAKRRRAIARLRN